jgi:hypothetical protein
VINKGFCLEGKVLLDNADKTVGGEAKYLDIYDFPTSTTLRHTS